MTPERGRLRWLILAATSRASAQRYAERTGLDAVVVDGAELARARLDLRALTERTRADQIAIHSLDWSRETGTQLYLSALMRRAPAPTWLIDESAGAPIRMSRVSIALALLRGPFQVAAGAMQVAAELVRFAVASRRVQAVDRPTVGAPRTHWVLVIWTTALDTAVGGSVTHISGIIKGFKTAGFQVRLVTTRTPPPQLAEVLTDVAVVPPPSHGVRVTPEGQAIATNGSLRAAAEKMRDREGAPSLIYQRHENFRVAGIDLARRWNVPLVLEWNASEVWAYLHWSPSVKPFRRLIARAASFVERRVVRAATLVTAVSDHAGEMAAAQGAQPHRIVVVPNAVDPVEIEGAREAPERPNVPGRLVGWIGSFAAWHGAEVLLRAGEQLPPDVELLMIGDGRQRGACVQLANELGIAERVHWTGAVAHLRALRLLAGCDLLVSPNIPLEAGTPFFGSPTKLFEYMALGKPIVASRLGQIGDILEHNRSALLVAPGDPDELAARIRDALSSSTLMHDLGEAARRDATAKHTWESRARLVLETLRLGEPRQPGARSPTGADPASSGASDSP